MDADGPLAAADPGAVFAVTATDTASASVLAPLPAHAPAPLPAPLPAPAPASTPAPATASATNTSTAGATAGAAAPPLASATAPASAPAPPIATTSATATATATAAAPGSSSSAKSLPPEIVAHIFALLTTKKDRLAFLRVCRSWRCSCALAVTSLRLPWASTAATPVAPAGAELAGSEPGAATTEKRRSGGSGISAGSRSGTFSTSGFSSRPIGSWGGSGGRGPSSLSPRWFAAVLRLLSGVQDLEVTVPLPPETLDTVAALSGLRRLGLLLRPSSSSSSPALPPPASPSSTFSYSHPPASSPLPLSSPPIHASPLTAAPLAASVTMSHEGVQAIVGSSGGTLPAAAVPASYTAALLASQSGFGPFSPSTRTHTPNPAYDASFLRLLASLPRLQELSLAMVASRWEPWPLLSASTLTALCSLRCLEALHVRSPMFACHPLAPVMRVSSLTALTFPLDLPRTDVADLPWALSHLITPAGNPIQATSLPTTGRASPPNAMPGLTLDVPQGLVELNLQPYEQTCWDPTLNVVLQQACAVLQVASEQQEQQQQPQPRLPSALHPHPQQQQQQQQQQLLQAQVQEQEERNVPASSLGSFFPPSTPSFHALPLVAAQLPAMHSLSIGGYGRSALHRTEYASSPLWGMPADLSRLSSLTELALHSLKELEQLPDSMCSLPNLAILSIRDCASLRRLPEALGSLSGSLRELHLHALRLDRLPESTTALFCLRALSLSHMHWLECLPAELGSLAGLEELSVTSCKRLPGLPVTFSALLALRRLSLLFNTPGLRFPAASALGAAAGSLVSVSLSLGSAADVAVATDALAQLTGLRDLSLAMSDDAAALDVPGRDVVRALPGLTALTSLRVDDLRSTSYAASVANLAAAAGVPPVWAGVAHGQEGGGGVGGIDPGVVGGGGGGGGGEGGALEGPVVSATGYAWHFMHPSYPFLAGLLELRVKCSWLLLHHASFPRLRVLDLVLLSSCSWQARARGADAAAFLSSSCGRCCISCHNDEKVASLGEHACSCCCACCCLCCCSCALSSRMASFASASGSGSSGSSSSNSSKTANSTCCCVQKLVGEAFALQELRSCVLYVPGLPDSLSAPRRHRSTSGRSSGRSGVEGSVRSLLLSSSPPSSLPSPSPSSPSSWGAAGASSNESTGLEWGGRGWPKPPPALLRFMVNNVDLLSHLSATN